MKKLLLLIVMLLVAYTNSAQIISIIGDTGPSANWSDDTDLTTTDNITYTLNNVFLTNASGITTGLKFRQDHDWTTNWGGTTFPSGTGVLGGQNIQTEGGIYNITFNRSNGSYTFIPSSFPQISIIGNSSSTGNWSSDVDMTTNDGINYSYNNLTLTTANSIDNEGLKFRQNHDWSTNWGGTTFPSGTGIANGQNIPTIAGTYNVSFNYTTKEYTFTVVPTISIIGPGAIDWNTDIDMQTSDGVNYYLYYPQNFNADAVKFRQNHSWDINWGGNSYPSGIAIPNGNDIVILAPFANSVSFNIITKEYLFVGLLNNNMNNSSNNAVYFYPNPTENYWYFNSNKNIDSIEISNILGKTILNKVGKSENIYIDATEIGKGVYFAKITIGNSIQTIKLIKN